MPATGVKVSGQLSSSLALSDANLKALNGLLETADFNAVATAEVNVYNGTRIEFDYEGPVEANISPSNLSFARKLAHVVETAQEANLDLSGVVIMQDTGTTYGGHAQKLVVAQGKTEVIFGLVDASYDEVFFAELGITV